MATKPKHPNIGPFDYKLMRSDRYGPEPDGEKKSINFPDYMLQRIAQYARMGKGGRATLLIMLALNFFLDLLEEDEERIKMRNARIFKYVKEDKRGLDILEIMAHNLKVASKSFNTLLRQRKKEYDE